LKFIDSFAMKTFLRVWSLIVLLTLSGVTVFGQDDSYVVDEIIAKVDNYIVLKSELDRAYLDYLANGGRPGEETRCQFLALLIRHKLMMAKAEIDSVVVLDEEVDANTQSRINMILAQSGNSAQQLEAIYGKSMEQIRLELRDQIKEQMVVREMERTISADIAVTLAEVQRFYTSYAQVWLTYLSAEVEVAQIVPKAKLNHQQKDATKRELIAIRYRILRG